MYDPSTGRFLSEDPLGFLGGDTNPARYVGNEVTKLVDPTGLTPVDPLWAERMAQILEAQKQAQWMLFWTYQAMQQQTLGKITGSAPAESVIPSAVANKQAQAAFQHQITHAMKKMAEQEAKYQLELLKSAKFEAIKEKAAASAQYKANGYKYADQKKWYDAYYKLIMLEMAEAAAKNAQQQMQNANQPK